MIDIKYNGSNRFLEESPKEGLRLLEELVAPHHIDLRKIVVIIIQFDGNRLRIPVGRQHPPLGQQHLMHAVQQRIHRLIHVGLPKGSHRYQQVVLPQQHLDPHQLFLVQGLALLLRHHQQFRHRRTEHMMFPVQLRQQLRRAEHSLFNLQMVLLSFPVPPADHIEIDDAQAAFFLNLVQMFLQRQPVAHAGKRILVTDAHEPPHQMLAVHHGRQHIPQARHQQVPVGKGVVAGIFQYKEPKGLAMERQPGHHRPVDALLRKDLVHIRIVLLQVVRVRHCDDLMLLQPPVPGVKHRIRQALPENPVMPDGTVDPFVRLDAFLILVLFIHLEDADAVAAQLFADTVQQLRNVVLFFRMFQRPLKCPV